MTHLFLFTIGPVQSFISQARKTKDLYAGSKILSELCKLGIETIEGEEYGGKVIFPYYTEGGHDSLPNRFIARLPNHSTKTFQEIGAEIEKKIKDKFEEDAETLLQTIRVKGQIPNGFDNQFRNQIKQHLDIHWVICPIKDSYLKSFEKTERILGSIKNLRSFTQNAEQGRKCSLDGQNNALFFGFQSNRNYVRYNGGEFVKGLNQNEGLSAISFVKRNYLTKSFPSTAGISVMDAIQKGCKFEIAIKEYIEYRNLFNGEFDEQLLFEENLTDKYFEKDELIKYKINLAEIRNKQKKFEQKLKSFNIDLPRYYALIHFDGDKMGSLISGSRLNNVLDKNDDNLPTFQKKVSQLLSNFANWASNKLLISPYGQTVYAGGDDFLGFVNLTHLLYVMQELREGFDCRVNKELQKEYSLDEDFTFSAGVVIAHYKEPLSLVMEQARQAEKTAKSDKAGNRNAFCLVASKGSGETHETCFKWHYGDNKVLEIANKLVEWLVEDKISKRFIVAFATEMQGLMEDNDYKINSGDYNADIIKTELKRLMLRARQSAEKEETEEFAKELASLHIGSKQSMDNFLQLLYICDFISRHINQNK